MTIATLFERVQAVKGGNPSLHPYLMDVDADMLLRYGIAYSELSELVNPDGQMIKSALDTGVTPREFVDLTARNHYMLAVGSPSLNGGDAGHFNKIAAIISDYVGKGETDWERRDRGICRPVEEGFALLRPVKVANDVNYGFGIEVRVGGVLSDNGYNIENLGEPGDRFAAHDLGEVIDRFNQAKTPAPKVF
jgi:hypothetical protein